MLDTFPKIESKMKNIMKKKKKRKQRNSKPIMQWLYIEIEILLMKHIIFKISRRSKKKNIEGKKKRNKFPFIFYIS